MASPPICPNTTRFHVPQDPELSWLKKAQMMHDPLLEHHMQQRLATANQTEEEWLSDVKFGVHHLNELGEILIKPHTYQLVMDMNDFQPEDIAVRAVHKGVYVKAAHPDLVDGKEYIAHHFYREYIFPTEIQHKLVKSWMTPEHILFIEAPKVETSSEQEDETSNEVPVVQQT